MKLGLFVLIGAAALSGLGSPDASAAGDFTAAIELSDGLRITGDSWNTAEMLVWLFRALAIAASTWLLILTGKNLQKDAAYDAIRTFIGAMIAGISPHLVQIFFYV